MIASDAGPALHWRCPSCGMQWVDAGSGFPGSRFSACLRCGRHATEDVDSRTEPFPPVGAAPRVRRLITRRR